MRCVRGVEHAESLGKHGGRFSIPIDLLRFIESRFCSTSRLEAGQKINFLSVLLCFLQTKLHSRLATSLSFDKLLMKYLQKPWVTLLGKCNF